MHGIVLNSLDAITLANTTIVPDNRTNSQGGEVLVMSRASFWCGKIQDS